MNENGYIGIISAMDIEVAALLSRAEIERVDTIGGVKYHVGTLGGKKVVITRSGLGKVYAGELSEGVAAFLTVGSLAAITAENWAKYGVKDWKTILFGTLGAVFYIGNIYGSYVSGSIHNNDLRNAQDTAILYHIHIPLRSVFQ